jgi:hypothetical protein
MYAVAEDRPDPDIDEVARLLKIVQTQRVQDRRQ